MNGVKEEEQCADELRPPAPLVTKEEEEENRCDSWLSQTPQDAPVGAVEDGAEEPRITPGPVDEPVEEARLARIVLHDGALDGEHRAPNNDTYGRVAESQQATEPVNREDDNDGNSTYDQDAEAPGDSIASQKGKGDEPG